MHRRGLATAGRVGDGVLTMSLGISSFGNYNDAVNQGADPNPNTQISLKTDGVREVFGESCSTKRQLDEHLELADQQYGQTHSIVIKFDLTTDDDRGRRRGRHGLGVPRSDARPTRFRRHRARWFRASTSIWTACPA